MEIRNQENIFNITFSDIIRNLLNCYYPQAGSLSALTSEERRKTIHRAIIYLKAELLLCSHWESIPNDDWLYMTEEKLVWHYLSCDKGLSQFEVMRLNKEEMFYLIYQDAIQMPVPQEVKSMFMADIASLNGFKVMDSLPWNPEKEWLPGAMLLNALKLNAGNLQVTSVH